MRSEQQHVHRRARVLVLASVLLGVFLPAVAISQESDSPPAAPASAPEERADAEAAESEAPRNEETPIITTGNARPSLDYEPSESISEDRSVSFPVDI